MLTKQLVLKNKDLAAANFGEIQAIKPQIGFIFGSMAIFNRKNILNITSKKF